MRNYFWMLLLLIMLGVKEEEGDFTGGKVVIRLGW